ncbi:MAG: hypothetical protein JWL89_344 [Candidatus Saccharibacteria bacterium]|nr:hypothetical protein [Candidatus Saccharibacteria bacterium]
MLMVIMQEDFQPQPASEYSAPPAPAPTPAPAKRKTHRGLWELLVVILLVAASIGGYYYGHEVNPGDTTVKTPAKTVVAPKTDASVHFVQSIGYPFDLGAKTQVVTRLGVPSSMQAVRSTSQSSGETLFTDKANDIMGYWVFGNPDNNNDNGGSDSEVAIYAMSKSWAAAINKTENTSSVYTDNQILQTPAQKQKYIADLKTKTAACATNKDKGFTVKDKSLDICYTLNVGKVSYDPRVFLTGYAEVENQPVVFVGTVNLYDPTTYATQDAELKAISEANAGKVPAKTQAALQNLIDALSQTTVTASPNQLKP